MPEHRRETQQFRRNIMALLKQFEQTECATCATPIVIDGGEVQWDVASGMIHECWFIPEGHAFIRLD